MLGFYKLNPNVTIPSYATEWAACFDLRAWFANETTLTSYTPKNEERNIQVSSPQTWTYSWLQHDWRCSKLHITIHPGHRVKIPTGLILDIPEGYSVRIHPRSGIALKRGLNLSNGEGIIDADYVEPLYILMTNTSQQEIVIAHDERIVQGELVVAGTGLTQHPLEECFDRPLQKTSRSGGFGSTGTA